MNDRFHLLIKNIGIMTVSNFSSKVLVFLLVPLYTSMLTTQEVGIYDLVTSTVALLFPLLTLNISSSVMRFLMDKSLSAYDVTSIGIRYLLYSIIPAVLMTIYIGNTPVFKSLKGFEPFIFFYYISFAGHQFFIEFAKGLEKVSAMAVAGISGTIATLAANIMLLIVFRVGLKGFFIANIIGQAVPFMYLATQTKVWTYLKTYAADRELQREMLFFCVPLIATSVGWWVNSSSDKYIVSAICGVAANGLLSVAYKVPSIINNLQSVVMQAWQISGIREYGIDGAARFYGKVFASLNLLMLIACSVLIILSKPIGRILYQKEFYPAWQFVPFLLISGVLNGASGFLGPILSAKKDSKSLALSAIYGALANVIMNVIFVYLIGIQGATIATMISSGIIYLVRKRAVRSEIEIVGYGIIVASWLLLMVQAAIEIYTTLWWVELLLIFVLMMLNRGEIHQITKLLTGKITKREP